jgi:hypothetical protein
MIFLIYTMKLRNTFNCYDSVGNWHLKNVSGITILVLNKLPEDGTLVPKHVGVGT